MENPAKLIVAIDFGTPYSGFSYAHLHAAKADPLKFIDKVQGFEQWPDQGKAGAKPYFKTQTSLLYVQKGSSIPVQYKLKAWGWSAFFEHKSLLKTSRDGKLDRTSFQFITNFKLSLAGSNAYGVNPSHSERAVVTGAVAYAGLGKIVISRISRKTYGQGICFPFRRGIDPSSSLIHSDDGEEFCNTRLYVFVQKGDPVAVDSCFKQKNSLVIRSEKTMEIGMYSTTNTDPTYVTDSGVVKECSLSIPIPSKTDTNEVPLVELSMYFGSSTIEVTAAPMNFESENGILPVKFITFNSEATS